MSFRVLLANSKGPGGGGARQAFQLAVALKNEGCEVIFSSRPHDGWVAQCREHDLEFLPLPYKHIGDLGTMKALIDVTRKRDINIVQVQKGREFALSLPACYLKRDLGLVVYRGVSFPLDPFNRQKYRLGRVDRVVAVSKFVERQLVDADVPPEKAVTIYGGVDPARFVANKERSEQLREELGLTGRKPIIGMIAHLRHWKRHDDLLLAAAELRRSYPDLAVLCVGRLEEQLHGKLVGQAKGLGLQDRVIFTGEREDVPDLLRLCSVSVNCADAGEGLTGALRESLLLRIPVVASDIAGNTEVIRDGETGLVFPPRDTDALAEAIKRMLTDEPLAVRCREAGYTLAMEKLTVKAQVTAYLKLYGEIVAARG